MVVDLKECRKIMYEKKRNYDYSLRGSQGCCFINGDKIAKIYEHEVDINDICDLRSYLSSHISFPIEYIFENGRVVGEIMPYFPYDTLNNKLTPSSKLDRFIVNYDEIIKEINLFPELLMREMDFCENILYDENAGMYLIDVSRWEKGKNCNVVNINHLNRTLMNIIMELIYGEQSYISRLLFDFEINYRILHTTLVGKEFLALIKANLECDYHLKELIDSYIWIVKKIYGVDIKTFKDVKKYTKIMKNS